MKITIAYIEEPPFYWTGPDQSVTGADIELAEVVLRAIGATSIAYHLTSFEEFLPGVQAGRWDMNVPIFVTAERAEHVAFSTPVWAIGDGLLFRRGDPKAPASYEDLAARKEARLGAVTGTIQIGAAKSAGAGDGQLVIFKDQPSAVAALLAGEIDAYASTGVGSRALEDAHGELEAVSLPMPAHGRGPVGAFSFKKDNHRLVQAVNGELRKYLGSEDHRARMAKYGITETEIDGVVNG